MALKNIPQAERLLSGTLTSYLSDVATTCVMSDPPSKFPTYIDLEPDSTTKKELVRAVAVSGSTVTIERSINGVTSDHAANATYKQKLTSRHWDAVSDALDSGYLMEDALRVLTRVSDTQFTITGYGASDDLTTKYAVGRYLRSNSSNSYVTQVTSSSYAAGTNKTTVNVADTLPTPLSTIEMAIGAEGGFAHLKVKATSAEITTGTEDAKIVTPKGLKDAGIVANSGILTTSQYAPQGFLINGKIVPSVASNNLTVAIKGMDGNDPSASNPVYVRIGDTVRTLTAALSVTKNAGTNWFNAGATELATKEIDYFVYLGYNTTDGVVIGFGRIPSANEYGDFSTTSTNEKYCAISTTTNAVSGDDYELVGRFAATLSAGAGYTWSVPTFTNKNLIQRPIYETRFLSYVPTLTWSAGVAPSGSPGINTHTYKITYNNMHVSNFVDGYSAGTSVTRVQITTPILPSGYFVNSGQITVSDTPNATTGYVASGGVMNLFCTSVAATRFTNTALFSI